MIRYDTSNSKFKIFVLHAAMKLQMTTGHEQLTLKQLWDGREVVFDAESDVDFFCRQFPFPLKFTRDATGKTTQVLAFDHDVWLREE